MNANPLIILLAILGGYFGAATLYQFVTGGNVSRMFGGSRVEIAVQLVGAVGAVLFMMRMLG